jgi:hypothetical protein
MRDCPVDVESELMTLPSTHPLFPSVVVPDREQGCRIDYARTIWLVSPKLPDFRTAHRFAQRIHLATTPHHLASSAEQSLGCRS